MSAEAVEVRAPDEVWSDAGDDVEGLVDEWLVGVGDRVEQDQTICTVLVVKTNFDIEAPVAGVVESLHVERGQTFGRADALATVRAEGA